MRVTCSCEAITFHCGGCNRYVCTELHLEDDHNRFHANNCREDNQDDFEEDFNEEFSASGEDEEENENESEVEEKKKKPAPKKSLKRTRSKTDLESETKEEKKEKKQKESFKPKRSTKKAPEKKLKVDSAKQVYKKHSEKSNNTTREVEKKCPKTEGKEKTEVEGKKKTRTETGKKSETEGKDKRKAEEPEEQTENQIEFLRTFSNPQNCTCFPKKNTKAELTALEDILFDSYNAADKQVQILIEQQREKKRNSKDEKSQQCDAFTILKKSNKFLILKTNSCHSMVNDQINKDDSMTLRPAVEPRLCNEEVKGIRMYLIKSCKACNKLEFENSIIITQGFDFVKLLKYCLRSEDESEKSEESEDSDSEVTTEAEAKSLTACATVLKSVCNSEPAKIKSVITKIQSISKSKQFNDQCRIIFVNKIQPNENPQTVQTGWTLHHSEIESLFFARKHGWQIMKIYIDRDCCKVCGATLGSLASDVHALIHIWHD